MQADEVSTHIDLLGILAQYLQDRHFLTFITVRKAVHVVWDVFLCGIDWLGAHQAEVDDEDKSSCTSRPHIRE